MAEVTVDVSKLKLRSPKLRSLNPGTFVRTLSFAIIACSAQFAINLLFCKFCEKQFRLFLGLDSYELVDPFVPAIIFFGSGILLFSLLSQFLKVRADLATRSIISALASCSYAYLSYFALGCIRFNQTPVLQLISYDPMLTVAALIHPLSDSTLYLAFMLAAALSNKSLGLDLKTKKSWLCILAGFVSVLALATGFWLVLYGNPLNL